jgi:hypothetical protein
VGSDAQGKCKEEHEKEKAGRGLELMIKQDHQ